MEKCRAFPLCSGLDRISIALSWQMVCRSASQFCEKRYRNQFGQARDPKLWCSRTSSKSVNVGNHTNIVTDNTSKKLSLLKQPQDRYDGKLMVSNHSTGKQTKNNSGVRMSFSSDYDRSLIRNLMVCLVIVVCATNTHGARMIRLCIASVDPVKLSSQCVMCNRREFPLTTIDCTGITKVNDLISNPLSVQAASCLILNCRRQVPAIKPEPYQGSVTHAARANFPSASGARGYEVMPPLGMFGGYFGNSSPFARYLGYQGIPAMQAGLPSIPAQPALIPGSLIGGPSVAAGRQQALPYALVPAAFPFGPRKYKATLMPLFR